MNRKRFRWTAVLMGIALLLTACGGKGSESTPQNVAPVPSGSKEKPPIKIGFVGYMSGPAAALGKWTLDGIKLAIDEVGGEIDGRKIELLVEDDAGDPSKSVNAYTKLAVQDKVDTIIGPVLSSSTVAVMPLANKYAMLTLTGSLAPEITEPGKGSKWVLRLGASDEYMVAAMMTYAVQTLKLTKIALINDSAAYGVGGGNAAVKTLKQLGVTPVAHEVFGPSDKEFAGQISKIKASGAEAIYIHGYQVPIGLFAKQMRQLKLNQTLLGTTGLGSPQTIEAGGKEALEGAYYGTAMQPDDPDPTVQEFVKRIDQKYHYESEYHNALGYDGTKALIAGMKQLKGEWKSSDELLQAVRKQKFTGVEGPFEFDDRGDPIKDAVIGQVKDGKLITVVGRGKLKF